MIQKPKYKNKILKRCLSILLLTDASIYSSQLLNLYYNIVEFGIVRLMNI